MAWKKIVREDTFEGSEAPFIAISSSHIAFNAMFVRTAELEGSLRVTVYVDEEDRKIGFEFHEDERPDSFALSSQSSDKKGEKRKGLQCSGQGILVKNPWIAAVGRQSVKNRRFLPIKEGNRWVIRLCPAFELRKARESADIPSDHVGIYRYVREDGEIVYVGRGPIKARLATPERAEWTFDVIEYSIVPNPDEQVRWEDYWIERYKDENNGARPIYNKLSGSSKHRNRSTEDGDD